MIWEESPIRGGLCLDGLHSTLTSLQREMAMMRDTLTEMDPEVFPGALARVRDRWKKNLEKMPLGDAASSQEYAEIIRKLKAREVC